mmetsp:Transcript_7491/g.18176  ORF Transcript_7491/g.18176 Transcript_7491/m.18176 type:complete len:80 (-) Transcript_7491:33-272(-)
MLFAIVPAPMKFMIPRGTALGAHSEYCFSDGSWCADGLPGTVPVDNTGYIYPEKDSGLGNGGFEFHTNFEGPGSDGTAP